MRGARASNVGSRASAAGCVPRADSAFIVIVRDITCALAVCHLRCASYLPWMALNITIAIVYSALAPLVTTVAVVFFVCTYTVHRQQLVLVYSKPAGNGGIFWPRLSSIMLTALLVYQASTPVPSPRRRRLASSVRQWMRGADRRTGSSAGARLPDASGGDVVATVSFGVSVSRMWWKPWARGVAGCL